MAGNDNKKYITLAAVNILRAEIYVSDRRVENVINAQSMLFSLLLCVCVCSGTVDAALEFIFVFIGFSMILHECIVFE